MSTYVLVLFLRFYTVAYNFCLIYANTFSITFNAGLKPLLHQDFGHGQQFLVVLH